MRSLTLLLCAGLAFSGCGDSSSGVSKPLRAPIPAGSWQLTPNGGRVRVPDWLTDTTAAFAEIDSTAALNVPGHATGVPSGWGLVILEPGLYPWREKAGGPIVQASGHTDYARQEIYVSWGGGSPLLPALAHEIAHVYAGPLVNH